MKDLSGRGLGAAFHRLGTAIIDLPFVIVGWVALASGVLAAAIAALILPVLVGRVGYFLVTAHWIKAACELNTVVQTRFGLSFPCQIDTSLKGLDVIFRYAMMDMDITILMLVSVPVAIIVSLILFGFAALRSRAS